MTSRDFCYWLQGFFEIRGFDNKKPLTSVQVEMIQKHLNLVFYHEIDNSFGKDKDGLMSLHGGASINYFPSSPVNDPKYSPFPKLQGIDSLDPKQFLISC